MKLLIAFLAFLLCFAPSLETVPEEDIEPLEEFGEIFLDDEIVSDYVFDEELFKEEVDEMYE